MSGTETLYVWPTRFRPHALVTLCPSVQNRGGFFATTEVVVFPDATVSSGYIVLSAEEYVERGADLDVGASAVRFNADIADKKEPFSLIWTPLIGDPDAQGLVHALSGPGMTPIMEEMVTRSATQRVDAQAVLRDATKLNGQELPSSLRPPTEAGLIKSRGIPGTNLRLVSRLSEELLKADGRIIHEVVIVAAVPEAIEQAGGLRCEVSLFPRGWVSMMAAGALSLGDSVTVPVSPVWGRPQEGRIGVGSRYVYEGQIAYNEFVVDAPPPTGRPLSGRLGTIGRVRVRLLRDDGEVCRLHHLFELEPPDTASPFAEAVQHLLDVGRLRDVDVAEAIGVPVDDVRGWVRDDNEPSGDETARVNELSSIVERLANVVRADYIALWLRKPVPMLGDEKPLDLLARGDYRAVSRLVAGLEAPVAS